MQTTLTHEEYVRRKHIPVLDGVRAISILLVVTHHPEYPGVWPIFHGATGVSIFFVLSGFLITMLLLREQQRSGRISLSAFYTRRLFRIAPLFLLAFCCYLVLIFGLGLQPERRASFVENIPYYLLFLPERAVFFNTWPEPVPFGGTWSLGIEEKFYFVWPVLGFVLLKSRPRGRVIALVLTVLASAVANAIGGSWGMALAPYGLLALGCLLAIALERPRGYAVVARLGRPRLLAVLGLGFVALQLSTDAITIGEPLYLVYGLAVAVVLGGLVVTRASWLRWLTARPMLLLGRLSYGLYLFHNFGLNFAEQIIPPTSFPLSLLSTLLGVGASVFGVWVLHLVVEKPCIRLGHRVSAAVKARTAARGASGEGVGALPATSKQTTGEPAPAAVNADPDARPDARLETGARHRALPDGAAIEPRR
jgi:peptidoglycan/LPS O-acetylase OafA/YrhL